MRAYFKARSYLPGVGIFAQVDPIDVTTGRLKDPIQLNAYAYATGNPLKYTDPSGKERYNHPYAPAPQVNLTPQQIEENRALVERVALSFAIGFGAVAGVDEVLAVGVGMKLLFMGSPAVEEIGAVAETAVAETTMLAEEVAISETVASSSSVANTLNPLGVPDACGQTSIAFDNMAKGNYMTVPEGAQPMTLGQIAGHYGEDAKFVNMSVNQIQNHLLSRGDGATGIVAGLFENNPDLNHAFNAVNNSNAILFIDSTINKAANLIYDAYAFLDTTGILTGPPPK